MSFSKTALKVLNALLAVLSFVTIMWLMFWTVGVINDMGNTGDNIVIGAIVLMVLYGIVKRKPR